MLKETLLKLVALIVKYFWKFFLAKTSEEGWLLLFTLLCPVVNGMCSPKYLGSAF